MHISNTYPNPLQSADPKADYAGKPVSTHKRVGSFMAVGLDLDGNGAVSTTTVAQNATRAPGGQAINFNWDNTNYQKKVGWVSANDAMLVLDKDFNQSVDNGIELLSNPLVADAAKGLRSLATWDANADGVINSLDAVYRQLKVWQDFNQDGDNTSYKTIGGRSQAVQDERVGANGLPDGSGTLELRSLSELGITSIDYNNNTHTKTDGSKKSIQTVQLEAQAEGTRYTPVKGGIKIETGTGNPEIIFTLVISEAATYDTQGLSLRTAAEAVNVDEDGSGDSFNPAPWQIATLRILSYVGNGTGLLENDTWHGSAGAAAGLRLTAVGAAVNINNLALNVDPGGNNSVTYSLPPNFYGTAGFDYTVTAPDGTTKTSHVTINVGSVDDAATRDARNHSQKHSEQRPYDGYIEVKNFMKKKSENSKGLKPEASRACERASRRCRPFFQRKKWQCQRHMVIVCFEINSEKTVNTYLGAVA